ncbi:unnamed protein product [Dibothriocephalus latus]|uniref:Uncharacterized protein n=1 Tax=Dibothriocephalus latus TaxID=60516 RepID=A0A3P7R3W8_DIBLA|nr:unnamed protein product [Dibothriocephalus latus]
MYEADILVEDGVITKLEKDISPPEGAEVIDAQGKLIFPGGVDCDCRLLNPSDEIPVADNFKSASLAALCGGTTTIGEFISTCIFSLNAFTRPFVWCLFWLPGLTQFSLLDCLETMSSMGKLLNLYLK